MSNVDIPLGASPARCALHPEVEARGTCARCGTFFCDSCVQDVFGKAWCATCAARPEVHYLERFRLKYWGKRDGSAWVGLMAGIAFAAGAIAGLWQRSPVVPMVAFLACSPVGVCFFLGLRWAREAFIGVPLLFAVLCVLLKHEGFAAFLLFVSLSGLTSYFDTRNQLFFRRPVSRKRLERLWDLRENNPLARRALGLGIGSIFLPVMAPIAVLCGVVALRRVDPGAMPPIGRKAEAMGAIVLGVGVMGVWAVLLARMISARWGFSLGG